ncbi:RidA family protein [Liquorilactobacillus sicerae]|uniref:RidA family protein n=1 Tax=Liquorilactobacillus sicerae TaxID=1416943 RepID=UPI002480953D|nr:Rid family detoxifying hydrolase [Liquorilactobacillus sicerae]
MKKAITTSEAPQALGAYSQAVKVGKTIYCSGQIGLNPQTGNFISEEVTEQAKQALKNLKAVLAKANFKVNDIVKVTIFMTRISDFDKINKVYTEFFKETEVLPARSAIGVLALPGGALVEIEAIAKK